MNLDDIRKVEYHCEQATTNEYWERLLLGIAGKPDRAQLLEIINRARESKNLKPFE